MMQLGFSRHFVVVQLLNLKELVMRANFQCTFRSMYLQCGITNKHAIRVQLCHELMTIRIMHNTPAEKSIGNTAHATLSNYTSLEQIGHFSLHQFIPQQCEQIIDYIDGKTSSYFLKLYNFFNNICSTNTNSNVKASYNLKITAC